MGTQCDDCERLRVQLAGCGVAALGGTDPARIASPGDYGWSAAYEDTLRLRQRTDVLEEAVRTIHRVTGGVREPEKALEVLRGIHAMTSPSLEEFSRKVGFPRGRGGGER